MNNAIQHGFEMSGKVHNQIYDVHDMCEWHKGLVFSVMHDILRRRVMACLQHVLILWTWYMRIILYMLKWMTCCVYEMQHNAISIGDKCFRILSTPGSCFHCIFWSLNWTVSTCPCTILWFKYLPLERLVLAMNMSIHTTILYYQCCIAVIPILSRHVGGAAEWITKYISQNSCLCSNTSHMGWKNLLRPWIHDRDQSRPHFHFTFCDLINITLQW